MTTPASGALAVSVSTDKDTYAVGDPIQVTVEYGDGTTATVQLTVTATVNDPATGESATGEAVASVSTGQQAVLPAEATDSFGDVYAEQSNAGGTAVFTSTVGSPPAGP